MKNIKEEKIRELKKVDLKDIKLFKDCVRNSIKNITSWNTESEYQLKKIKFLLEDVRKFLNFVENDFSFQEEYPFNRLYIWLEKETCEECIEYIVSIMMEPFNEIVKPLAKKMSSDDFTMLDVMNVLKWYELIPNEVKSLEQHARTKIKFQGYLAIHEDSSEILIANLVESASSKFSLST